MNPETDEGKITDVRSSVISLLCCICFRFKFKLKFCEKAALEYFFKKTNISLEKCL